MTDKVVEILSKFDELDKEAQKIGLKQVKLAREALSASTSHDGDIERANLDQIRKYAAASASEFIGRDTDEKKLLEVLCNSDKKKCLTIHLCNRWYWRLQYLRGSVVPEIFRPEKSLHQGRDKKFQVVRTGGQILTKIKHGLGKTTLARRLYDHEKVKARFANRKAWVCVSENFNIERLVKEMLESLSQNGCKIEELQGKNFLFILDDVWNDDIELWDSLRNHLFQKIQGVAEIVLLITTRNSQVAHKAGVVYLHKLEGLSSEESWELFKQRVCINGLESIDSPFVDIGIRIVKKCKGVPLAIKAIGGILQSKKHLSEWELLNKSEIWDLPQEDKNYIMPSLLLSYNNLPFLSVKLCFDYCAIFPKDYTINKYELISLWAAQGYLHTSGTCNSILELEKRGDKYFSILVNNSFLQEEKDKGIYKMHDLVHDLALYISQKDLLVWKEEDKPDPNFNHRHLVCDCTQMKSPKTPKGDMLHKLGTLTINHYKVPDIWDTLIYAKFVRTLIVHACNVEKVPSSIGQLKHLRYLDLSYNPIGSLPDSIGSLYQLQTLRLKYCNLVELPSTILRLIHLRQVIISGCSCLQLPTFGHLPNLRVLELRYFDNVESVGDEFYISHHNVRALSIDGETSSNTENLLALKVLRIQSFKRLKTFVSPPLALTAVAFPCLETLHIVDCPMLRAIELIPTPSFKPQRHIRLEKVIITGCKDCQRLPTLGHLPNLRILELIEFSNVECISEEFYISHHNEIDGDTRSTIEVFPALRHLRIQHFRSLTTFMAPPPGLAPNAFPCLETLDIDNCAKLEVVETTPSLSFKSLRHLRLDWVGGSQPLDIIKYHNSGSLISLHLHMLEGMTSLPQAMSNCTRLEKLYLNYCPKLTFLPTGMKSLVSLQSLKIESCHSLTSLPDYTFPGLSSLCELSIYMCRSLAYLPEDMFLGLTSLRKFHIDECWKLIKKSHQVWRNAHL